MVFFRQMQHLLPDAHAWRLTATSKALRKFFEGLAAAPAELRAFFDSVYDDLDPARTRELAAWEKQFGLDGTGVTEETRRAQLAGAWQAQGGQSPRYLQDVVRAAGFDVYVHEWWVPGTMPRVKRDPRAHATQPRMGTHRCGLPESRTGRPDVMCDRMLVNGAHYLVNTKLSSVEYREVPPPLPSDPAKWPFMLYWGGQVFGTPATVPAARRREFERLLLRICPAHLWIVPIVEYV